MLAEKCHKNEAWSTLKGCCTSLTCPKFVQMDVALRNKATGQIKFHKIGWSWSCFFAAELVGIPLFRRGLYGWGAVIVALWMIDLLSPDLPLEEGLALSVVLLLLGTVLSLFFGAKANTLAGRRYLATGWEFARPNSEEAETARLTWGVASAREDDDLT